MNPSDDKFLGLLRKQLQYAIQWLPKGAIGPMQVRPSATVGQVLTTTANGAEWQSSPAGVTDHGLLTGLADDDHTQYHNDARGDARYWQLSTDLATQAELDAHTSDATDAHPGTAITNTPAGNIAATTVQAAINELDSEKQPLDSDLTTIAGLTATTDNFLQAKSSAWASRTPAQVVTDLQAAGLAPLASPAFTGTPSLPTGATGVTQAENDASTKLSTTAYVDRATGNASSNRPMVNVARTTLQSLAITTWTAIQFDTELTDTDSMWTSGANTRLTATTAGNYIVTGHVNIDNTATNQTHAARLVHKNSAGTIQAYYAAEARYGAVDIDGPTLSKVLALAAGDYVELQAYSSVATNTASFSNSHHASFSMAWVGGTGAAWGNAGCRVYSSSATSIPNTGAPTAVTFNSETFDTDGMHSTSSNTDRITCVTPGTYLVTGQIQFASSTAAGIRGALIYKNGASVGQTQIDAGDSGAIDHSLNVSALVQMVAGDYVQLMGQNWGAGALNTTTGEATHFSAVRVGYQTNPADLPGTYVASMYAANSGAPTHTSNGGWQKVGSGGGTLTWTSEIDKRPSGVSAQVDTATNKRIDIRKTGLYRVGWGVAFSAIADAKRATSGVYKNGTEVAQDNRLVGLAGTPLSGGTKIISLTSGDYLELYANQADSASEAYEVSQSHFVYLQAEYLGPAS